VDSQEDTTTASASEADVHAMSRSPHNVCRQTETNLRAENARLHEIINSRAQVPSREAALREALQEIVSYRGKGDCATDLIDIAESALHFANSGVSHAGNAGEDTDGARWRFMMAIADNPNGTEADAMELFANRVGDDDSRPESAQMAEIVDKARAAIASSAEQEGK
jgi:hypothetical protein